MARISLNKLGEYMTARGGRRRRIILDQQLPQTYLTSRYAKARSAICSYLKDGDAEALIATQQALSSSREGTEHQIEVRMNCAEAIDAFARLDRHLGLGNEAEFYSAPSKPHHLEIGGVDISVAPDVLVRVTRRGREQWGAVKLYFAKGADYQLQEDGARFVATLLHEWCSGTRDGESARPSFSLSVDVFRGRVVAAPTARTRRLEDIEASCEEIARAWRPEDPAQGRRG